MSNSVAVVGQCVLVLLGHSVLVHMELLTQHQLEGSSREQRLNLALAFASCCFRIALRLFLNPSISLLKSLWIYQMFDFTTVSQEFLEVKAVDFLICLAGGDVSLPSTARYLERFDPLQETSPFFPVQLIHPASIKYCLSYDVLLGLLLVSFMCLLHPLWLLCYKNSIYHFRASMRCGQRLLVCPLPGFIR